MEKFLKFSAFVTIFTGFILLVSLGVTFLWNMGLSPVIEGVNDISYSQSIGLLGLVFTIKIAIENLGKININHVL